MTAGTVQQIWVISLGVFVVVLIVVAALLALILGTARRIRAGVAAIWAAGQKVANNTVHLALLDRTNFVADRILQSAAQVAGATEAIAAHASACPGCPGCVIGKGGAR